VNYLLDTNACIALINGRPVSVRARLQKALAAGSDILVSSVVAFELWHGVAKSSRSEFNAKRLQAFFAGPITPIAFEDQDAQATGAIRAELEKTGKPIGAYDVLIASQALRHGFTLVTANHSEFARIKGLMCRNWA